MSSTAVVPVASSADSVAPVDPCLLRLKQMVVDSLAAANSKRNYANALEALFAFSAGRPLTPGGAAGVAGVDRDAVSFDREHKAFGDARTGGRGASGGHAPVR